MAMAYTPGLKRKEFDIVRKTRTLPMKGEVLVKEGEKVTPSTIVARTETPGPPEFYNVATALDLEPAPSFSSEELTVEVRKYMLKKEGEHVDKGEIIANYKAWFGLINRVYRSPIKGTIELINDQSGQIVIRTPPISVKIDAYITGTIAKVISNEGVVVETLATFIQGIFGIGGEIQGEIKVLVNSPDDILTAEMITPECAGKAVVGGSLVGLEALRKAVSVGVKAIVVGGIEDKDLSAFLGYSIGVAVTGHERVGLTLIITEGFGKMSMASKTFELLKKCEGKLASVNGSTQIRAGVMRPEIIIPQASDTEAANVPKEDETLMQGMRPGLPIRVIHEPYFGFLGHITRLIPELQELETESSARVLEVELSDGRRVILPRANVELIEE